MSKSKLDRRFNKRARLQPIETKIDESEQNRLTKAFIESEGRSSSKDVDYSTGYDAANALVLPAKKRKVKHKYDVQINDNKLSKKEKKRLEKIVEIKDNKANRQKIFESLAMHRASEKAEARFVSVVNPDGGGGGGRGLANEAAVVTNGVKINSIAGSNKKNKKAVVEDSSEEDEEDDDEEESDENMDDTDKSAVSGKESSSNNEVGNEGVVKELPHAADNYAVDAQDAISDKETVDTSEAANNRSPDSNQSSAKKGGGAPATSAPAKFVIVERREEIAAARMKLPIFGEEQNIVETINDNDVSISE